MPFGQSYWLGKLAGTIVGELTGSQGLALAARFAVSTVAAVATVDPAGKAYTLAEMFGFMAEGGDGVVQEAMGNASELQFGSSSTDLFTNDTNEPVVSSAHSYDYGYKNGNTGAPVDYWDTHKT